MQYAIHDSGGYWFKGFEDGEPLFVNAKHRAQKFGSETDASEQRDALAQMCADGGMGISTFPSVKIEHIR